MRHWHLLLPVGCIRPRCGSSTRRRVLPASFVTCAVKASSELFVITWSTSPFVATILNKRNSLELDHHAVLQSLRGSLTLVQMSIIRFFAQTHFSILLESIEENQTQPIDRLEVIQRNIPTVKKNAPCQNTFVTKGVRKHFSKVFIFIFPSWSDT